MISCLFFLSKTELYAQASCSGSLGDPIINVTFGAGDNPGAPLATAVPGASTSYTYVAPTGTPPANIILDGDYSLVNAFPPNPGWLTATDHTGDTKGYMAFFNAAPNPGEFYRQTITGLCSGTVYEFAAWVINAINVNVISNAVPPNVTFRIYDPANTVTPLVTFSTGDIPATSTPFWRRFSTLFTTPAGLNSVILTLSNNNVGGTSQIGNDLAIDDITFRACGPLTQASFSSGSISSALSVCPNTSFNLYGTVSAGLSTPAYQWQISTDNGQTWTNIAGATTLNFTSPGYAVSGPYKLRLVSQEAANISSPYCKFYSNIINLIVKPKSFFTNNQSICEGQTYQGHGVSGTYITTLIAANGCDSIYTLNLTVKPKTLSTVTTSICDGQSYAGHTTGGTFTDTYTGVNGCDSIRTLNLTIKPRSFTTNNQFICEGQTYQGHNVSGTYITTLVAANGCDSVYTLNLTVKPRSFTTNNQSICEGQSYQGHSTTGTYTTTLVAANGCDSIYTLNLTVKPKSFTTNNQSICEGQSYEGHSTTGSYVSTLVAANGCDSIYTLNLTVKPKTFSSVNATVCEGQSYAGHTTAGTYTDTYTGVNGCDSIRALTLTIKPRSFSTNNQSICAGQTFEGHNATGTYTTTFMAANGCDSLYTLNLTVKPLPLVNTISDTAICNTQTITLTTIGNASSYSWSPAIQLSDPTAASPQFSGTPGHKYYVTGILNGCSNIDSVTITVNTAASLVQPPNKSFCFKDSVKLDGNNGNNVTYIWTGNYLSDNNIKDPIAYPPRSTIYSVKITDLCNYDSTFFVRVTVLPLPSVKAQKTNDVNCVNTTSHLSATGGLLYTWTPSQTLSQADIPNPLATPNVTTTYYVTGSGNNGCFNKDSITVIKDAGNGNVYVPNTFSPNGDGKNDCFHVLVTGVLDDFTMLIYNRWGVKMFESHNISECWDGKYKGAKAPIDSYVYYVYARTSCGYITYKGNLALIR